MAVMTAGDRQACCAQFIRERAPSLLSGLTKPDLRAAVEAIDQWVSDNALTLNLAFPQPARANLTAVQKAELLMFVVTKRFRVGA